MAAKIQNRNDNGAKQAHKSLWGPSPQVDKREATAIVDQARTNLAKTQPQRLEKTLSEITERAKKRGIEKSTDRANEFACDIETLVNLLLAAMKNGAVFDVALAGITLGQCDALLQVDAKFAIPVNTYERTQRNIPARNQRLQPTKTEVAALHRLWEKYWSKHHSKAHGGNGTRNSALEWIVAAQKGSAFVRPSDTRECARIRRITEKDEYTHYFIMPSLRKSQIKKGSSAAKKAG